MTQMYGTVEVFLDDLWCSVIDIASLILPNSDLNACMCGVGNYAGFVPLFADRGIPPDLGMIAMEDSEYFSGPNAHPSWVLWKELEQVDWTETAPDRDVRISEYSSDNGELEQWNRKWVEIPGLEWIRKALDDEPNREIRHGSRIYRRVIMTRNDALDGTEFPLVMKLMACLASRFGGSNVRLFVWFD